MTNASYDSKYLDLMPPPTPHLRLHPPPTPTAPNKTPYQAAMVGGFW